MEQALKLLKVLLGVSVLHFALFVVGVIVMLDPCNRNPESPAKVVDEPGIEPPEGGTVRP